MKLTYQALLENPDLMARILADAKRERARAIAALFRRPAEANAGTASTAAALTAACG